MGCCELPCIHERDWVLAMVWKEMTANPRLETWSVPKWLCDLGSVIFLLWL